jgi:hypothetical protein
MIEEFDNQETIMDIQKEDLKKKQLVIAIEDFPERKTCGAQVEIKKGRDDDRILAYRFFYHSQQWTIQFNGFESDNTTSWVIELACLSAAFEIVEFWVRDNFGPEYDRPQTIVAIMKSIMAMVDKLSKQGIYEKIKSQYDVKKKVESLMKRSK